MSEPDEERIPAEGDQDSDTPLGRQIQSVTAILVVAIVFWAVWYGHYVFAFLALLFAWWPVYGLLRVIFPEKAMVEDRNRILQILLLPFTLLARLFRW